MASYRFSISVIKRSVGRSVTAASAYRAACEIACDRYGEHHDYTRKQGVLHSEIITPDNTPEWMTDRSALWNAVEAIEKRKDAQLAREVQLSLPHELTDDQRRELVRSFVSSEFVSWGMIADVNIHAPHRDGDGRNHHAHVLLTMRELAGEGFGKKERGWNASQQLEHWREAWADHQNRAFERLGLSVRVDHRSLEGQGIEREPQQHRGPKATAMERRGEATRIGDKNRATEDRNAARSRELAQLAKIEAELQRERERFADWMNRAKDQLWGVQFAERDSLKSQQHQKKQSLERDLKATYGDRMKATATEAREIKARIEKGGLRGFVRKLTGAQAKDEQNYRNHKRSYDDAKQRVDEQRQALESKQTRERQEMERRQQQAREVQEARLKAAEQRKEQGLKKSFDERKQNLRTPPGPAVKPARKPRTRQRDRGPDRGFDI